MTPLRALILLTWVAVSGCDGSSERSGTPGESGGTPAPVDREASSSSVAPAVLESCAGFTVETAAELLGVPAGELEVRTGRSEELGGHLCRYWSQESLIGPGVQILFEVESSPSDAAGRLASLRNDAPAGEAAIRSATGQQGNTPSIMAFDGIGDEAFWDPLTGGVSVRVGSVVASIQASTSRQAASHSDPAQIELERRVAERIASGLADR